MQQATGSHSPSHSRRSSLDGGNKTTEGKEEKKATAKTRKPKKVQLPKNDNAVPKAYTLPQVTVYPPRTLTQEGLAALLAANQAGMTIMLLSGEISPPTSVEAGTAPTSTSSTAPLAASTSTSAPLQPEVKLDLKALACKAVSEWPAFNDYGAKKAINEKFKELQNQLWNARTAYKQRDGSRAAWDFVYGQYRKAEEVMMEFLAFEGMPDNFHPEVAASSVSEASERLRRSAKNNILTCQTAEDLLAHVQNMKPHVVDSFCDLILATASKIKRSNQIVSATILKLLEHQAAVEDVVIKRRSIFEVLARVTRCIDVEKLGNELEDMLRSTDPVDRKRALDSCKLPSELSAMIRTIEAREMAEKQAGAVQRDPVGTTKQ